MKRSAIQTLILKDWDRHRSFMILSIVGGGLALALLQIRSEVTFILGSTWFFISLIVLGCMLPIANVINERKKQTLPFLMSLPLSAAQYTTAKLISTVGIYLLPWSTLLMAAVLFILGRKDIPDGIIPATIVLGG